MNRGDTIAAISTPLGEGGIGIVRLSGPDSFRIGEKLFQPARKPSGIYPKNRYLYHGFVKNEAGELLDEVLLSFMKAPHTFTREDVVEINGHGGATVLRMILKEVIRAGARLAEPGEFTRRAFLNGRIDLSQAESMLKLIRARSEKAVKIATANVQGILSSKVEELRERALVILAHLEARLDFPDEINEEQDLSFIGKELVALEKGVERLLKGAERGLIYQEGVATAIIGKPNVGKSSLLNALLGQKRAIVHEAPGTTRDLLEGLLVLEGFTIRLIDTAGIHGATGPVEQIGVEQSREVAGRARLLLIVFDGSSPMTKEDEVIIGLLQEDQKAVFILNKMDLGLREEYRSLSEKYPEVPLVSISALKEEGLEELEGAITGLLGHKPALEEVEPLLVSMRHLEAVTGALEAVQRARLAWGTEPMELVSYEIRSAWGNLGEITGDTVSDELLDYIFKEFCLGK
ncbi:MAG: tRNA uridine-5-carboxymethylaminomethyl(34) synthesis GTPase MnmE [Firmicutes bacterium]|nr:tRNA uridine-5-carboxymethylaminomethyl(34) synthesis GTPase MnmE [Bacillota bacterium]